MVVLRNIDDVFGVSLRMFCSFLVMLEFVFIRLEIRIFVEVEN